MNLGCFGTKHVGFELDNYVHFPPCKLSHAAVILLMHVTGKE